MNAAPILFIARHAARPGTDSGEGWDAVMVCAAFDRRTTVLLLDDAVEWLHGASGDALGAVLDAGVDTLCVAADAMQARGAQGLRTDLHYLCLENAAIRALIAAHPIVISI